MRRSASLLTAVPVIASLFCASATTAHAAVAGPAAPATAGSAPAAPLPAGWRIVAAFPAGSSVDELAASGPGSAWAVESCRKPCRSGNGVILRHWTGKAWQPQAQPAVSRHAGDDEPQLAIAPGSKNVWAVPAPGRALGQWIASARSASDIWTQSIAATGPRLAVSHWTGKRWVRQAVPAAPKGAHGTTITDVAAIPGSTSVYGYGEATTSAGQTEGVILRYGA